MNRSWGDWRDEEACVCVCALQASRLYQNCPVCLGWFLLPSMSEFLELPIGSCLCSPNTGPYPSTTTHCLTWFFLPWVILHSSDSDTRTWAVMLSVKPKQKRWILKLFCPLCHPVLFISGHVFLHLHFTGAEPFSWSLTALLVSVQTEGFSLSVVTVCPIPIVLHLCFSCLAKPGPAVCGHLFSCLPVLCHALSR